MTHTGRQPTIFLSHGGGPCFWMEFGPPFGPHAFDKLRHYLAGLLATLPQRPRAIVLISAHWEEEVVTIGSGSNPAMIYDYYGFPAHTYTLNYPAAGDPALASDIEQLLTNANIPCRMDASRGFDHGVFVPMMIIDPEASIPVVTLSLQHGLNADDHLALGAALAPLRDDNVLILGSGNSYHNLREFFDGTRDSAAIFDTWLSNTMLNRDAGERHAALANWSAAPQARACHPREEHLIPLMVVAGAGGSDAATRSFHDVMGGKTISGFTFGAIGG